MLQRLLFFFGVLAIPLVAAAAPPQILVYSATAGYRHDSIPTAINALQEIATNTSLYDPTFSEDENLFTPDQLAQFKAIVFLSNSDQVLTDSGETALTEWLGNGGVLVGLHSGNACLFNDTAFGTAMGAFFHRHPAIQNATFIKVIDHEIVDMLPDRYTTYEEVYSHRSSPTSVNASILLSVDSNSYIDDDKDVNGSDGAYWEGTPHPIAWYRDANMNVDLSNGTGSGPWSNGRVFYTSLGHTNETWQSPLHLQHVEAGLRWALAEVSSTSTNATSSTPQTSTAFTSSTASPTATSMASALRTLYTLRWTVAASIGATGFSLAASALW
ncbi:hypothetical protein JCM1841_005327 [Sporobolomyces salmonicolor]